MKKIAILFFAIFALASNGFAVGEAQKTSQNLTEQTAVAGDFQAADIQNFASLSADDYEKITGEKLGLVGKMKMKIAQKQLKKAMKKAEKQSSAAGGDIDKGLYIVLAIFGLAWIAMGVMDDWQGSTWIINLLLTFLFWLPGLIHALVVMNKYYGK